MRMLTRLTVLCAGESSTFGRAGAFGAGKLRVRVSITGLVNHLKRLRVQAAHEAALREQKAAAKRRAIKRNLPPPHLVSLQLHACRRPMCCNRWARARGGGWTSPRTGGRGTRPPRPAASPVRARARERRLTGCCSVGVVDRQDRGRRGVPTRSGVVVRARSV